MSSKTNADRDSDSNDAHKKTVPKAPWNPDSHNGRAMNIRNAALRSARGTRAIFSMESFRKGPLSEGKGNSLLSTGGRGQQRVEVIALPEPSASTTAPLTCDAAVLEVGLTTLMR